MSAGWGRVEFYIKFRKRKNYFKNKQLSFRGRGSRKRLRFRTGNIGWLLQGDNRSGSLLSDKRKKNKTVIFQALQEIPEKILAEGEMALLGRKELEKIIEEKTKKLQEKVEELEKYAKLTTARELRMIELKEEIKNLKKQLEEKKQGLNFE